MATENPKGAEETVALNLSDRQRQFLRRAVADCKAGREDDLQTQPQHPNAARWRAEGDAYARIIVGLEAGAIVPDGEVRGLLRELAEANDREEEYERVVFEHDALVAMREQIEAAG